VKVLIYAIMPRLRRGSLSSICKTLGLEIRAIVLDTGTPAYAEDLASINYVTIVIVDHLARRRSSGSPQQRAGLSHAARKRLHARIAD
jgi:hypothetical protein